MTGYPDFTRVTQSGGVEKWTFSGTPLVNIVSKLGYVANWPYINFYSNIAASSYNLKLLLDYYTDDTYTTLITEQEIVRTGGTQSASQYPVPGPYLKVTLTDDSSGNIDVTFAGLFATYGMASSRQLLPAANPIIAYNSNIAASSTVTEQVPYLIPGPGVLNVYTAAASWNMYLQYWNYASSSWKTFFRVNSSIAASGGTWRLPQPDATCQLVMSNSDTAARQFVVTWLSDGF